MRRRSAHSGVIHASAATSAPNHSAALAGHVGRCRRRRVPLEYHSAALVPMRANAAATAGVSARGRIACCALRRLRAGRWSGGTACRCEQAARRGLYEVLELHSDVAKHISFSLELCGSCLLPRYSGGTKHGNAAASSRSCAHARRSRVLIMQASMLQVRGRSQTAGVHP